MLAHPTLDLLHTLGLHGMAKGYQELDANPEARSLEHAEWLGLLPFGVASDTGVEHNTTPLPGGPSRRR